MVNQVRMKLLGAEIMVGLKKLDLAGVDLSVAKQIAQAGFYCHPAGHSRICGCLRLQVLKSSIGCSSLAKRHIVWKRSQGIINCE